jgi:hypothetical protein
MADLITFCRDETLISRRPTILQGGRRPLEKMEVDDFW